MSGMLKMAIELLEITVNELKEENVLLKSQVEHMLNVHTIQTEQGTKSWKFYLGLDSLNTRLTKENQQLKETVENIRELIKTNEHKAIPEFDDLKTILKEVGKQ